MYEEIIDIVDEHDVVIGQKKRTELDKTLGSGNFRAINAFIENDKGQLWIPRRTATKKLFPLALDTSVGGCVAAGESYEQAFARETVEEINIDIKDVSYSFVAYVTPQHHGVSGFMKVYKIYSNHTPNYNPEDFCESF